MEKSMIGKISKTLSGLGTSRRFETIALPAFFLLLAGTALAHVVPASLRSPFLNSIRMRVSFETPAPKEVAPPAACRGAGVRGRAGTDVQVADVQLLNASRPSTRSPLQLRQGRIVMLTAYGEKRLRGPADEMPDTTPFSTAPKPAVTLLAVKKTPALADPDVLECPTLATHDDNLQLLASRLGVASSAFALPLTAQRYHQTASQYARQYNISPKLVMAIIRTESNFNPFAVSNRNAVGLMQVVPDSAGGEVYNFLNGEKGIPDAGTLFDPDHNIKYGVTYLHLLERKFFGRIRNTASREMCIIAAYNGGPGAVLRVFDQDIDTALGIINNLPAEKVYEALTTRMPSEESRRYVDIVLGRMRGFDAPS